MLDFYVVVDDYRRTYRKTWLRLANRLLPPNVFYFECPLDGVVVRAKYAVLSAPHLGRLVGQGTFNPAVWARFAQPVALVYVRDTAARATVTAALADAAVTTLAKTAPLAPATADARGLWRNAFALTYATEFRAERAGRPTELFDLERDFYGALTAPALACAGVEPGRGGFGPRVGWALRRLQGRALHLARLIKAAATFAGGVDYLAWKIERHSGVKLTVRPWQRRHPVIAGLALLPRLLGKGAVR